MKDDDREYDLLIIISIIMLIRAHKNKNNKNNSEHYTETIEISSVCKLVAASALTMSAICDRKKYQEK